MIKQKGKKCEFCEFNGLKGSTKVCVVCEKKLCKWCAKNLNIIFNFDVCKLCKIELLGINKGIWGRGIARGAFTNKLKDKIAQHFFERNLPNVNVKDMFSSYLRKQAMANRLSTEDKTKVMEGWDD